MGLSAKFGFRIRDIRAAACLPTDVVGDFVYISGPLTGQLYTVTKADPQQQEKMPAVGVIISKSSDTSCLVQLFGETPTMFTGLVPGKPLFIGADAKGTQVPPGDSNMFVQHVGVALSETKAYLKPADQLLFIS